MSSKSIVDQIRHYQKDIERCPENSERMIRCIQRLYVLPILVQHLQETGVGRSVNSLRKFNGEVGEAAKALVTKWKAMVAAEESDDGEPAPKETDGKRNPPNSHSSENGLKASNDSFDVSKHDSTRHSSSHKRSHSSTTSESKADRKSSSSSTEKTDRKSSSEKSNRHRQSQHESKSNETVQVRAEKGSKSHVKSKDNDRPISSSKSDRKGKEDDSDRSPCRKKRKKYCVKERRKEAHESDDGSSSREDAAEDIGSDSERVLPDLLGEDSDDDRGDLGGNNSSQGSDDNEDAGSEKGSSSDEDSDPKSRKKSSSEHHKPKSSSHSGSSSSKHKHGHQKEVKKSSSSSSKSSSKDLHKMIKENEKKIKKEKSDKTNYDSGGSTPKGSSSPTKSKDKSVKIKVETNEDGSIDAGSGFSFADALAGLNPAPKKKKKGSKDDVLSPKPSCSNSSRNSSSSTSSHSQKKSSSSSVSVKKEKHFDTAMPELLMRPIKLENLELDINSTLPEINPNYRPLPHVPENSRRNSTKTATNEEEMFNMMMNKNQRTKVFSGGKSNLNTQVPSLYDLCIKLLYDNIDGLEYTGGVPYDLLKPLLEKLNPDQLFVLEHYNAYLIEDTGTLWEFHAKKDFRNKGRQEGETWRDLYIRCMEEREEKLKALTQNISQSIAASTPVRKAKLAYVDSAVKPPRNIARKQVKYGTGGSDSIMKAHSLEKREILAKAVVGAHNPANIATTTVPAPPQSSAPRNWSTPAPSVLKKRKAPLMAKALQLIKGTNRFKR